MSVSRAERARTIGVRRRREKLRARVPSHISSHLPLVSSSTHINEVAGVRPHVQLIRIRRLGRTELSPYRASAPSSSSHKKSLRTIFHRSSPPNGSTVLRARTLWRFPSWPSFSCAARAASSASRVSRGGGSGGSCMCCGCHGEGSIARVGGKTFWRLSSGAGTVGLDMAAASREGG
jgi:hypothetical protein